MRQHFISQAASMNLIVYAGHEDLWQRLCRMIQASEFDGGIEIYTSIVSLSHGIRRNGSDNLIAILLVRHRREMRDIAQLSDRLQDFSVILVLPDREAQTVSLGFRLYPRFIGYADDDLEVVRSVLHKMMTRHQANYLSMN